MEQVVLLDDAGQAIGVADKATVHHQDTPLHLAFSCYVFNEHGQFLLTQRAHHKRTWPGVWTNSCCGHPSPAEPITEAIQRRLDDELGLDTSTPAVVLSRFQYRAVMSNGVAENEMCPVYVAYTRHEPHPNVDEVAGTRWVDWEEFSGDVLTGRAEVSPWCVEQIEQLAQLGPEPAQWPKATDGQLPAAARQPV